MTTISAWQPERHYNVDEIQTVLRRDFPDLGARTTVLIGEGMDNCAYLVDNTYVFRFPRRAIAANLIDSEIIALSHTALLLPISVPVPLFTGLVPAAAGWRYVGYRRLPGFTGCSIPLTLNDRKRLATDLGNFLRILHSIPIKSLVDAGLPQDTIGRLDIEKRTEMCLNRLMELQDIGFLADTTELIKILNRPPTHYQNLGNCLVHGDLYSRHLLFNAERNLCGVIDWGDVHYGDVAVDLAVAHLVLPPQLHSDFLMAYGEVKTPVWQLARLRAIWHSSLVAAYGTEIRDENLIESARTAFDFIAPGSAV